MMEIESPKRSDSPEFEFWIHSEIEPSGLLTADELFVDGVLLPLHLLSVPPPVDPNREPPKPPPPPAPYGSGGLGPPNISDPKQQELSAFAPPSSAPGRQEGSICCSSNPAASLTSSKRWKDILKIGDKKKETAAEKKERKASNGEGSGGGGTAELNINIWPFSRSRSAGTAASGRPKAAAMRKSSSAPCSRSNSRGENGRRWAASPGRPGVGVHVGRASPVWQVRRAGKGAEAGAGRAGKAGRPKGGNRGLGLNVNSCIGYRSQVRCRGEGCEGGGGGGGGGGDDDDERAGGNNNNNNNNGSFFKFRALFSKRVY